MNGNRASNLLSQNGLPSLLLSREELLAILAIINVSAYPGIATEPIGKLSPEQQAYGLIVAERALRARSLAALSPEGRLLIQKPVLALVGAAIYAQESLFVTQVAAPSAVGVQLDIHRSQDCWVIHTRPELVIHAFQSVRDESEVVAWLDQQLGWPTSNALPPFHIELSNERLGIAREQAERGHRDAVAALLAEEGAPAEVALTVASLLCEPHLVTVLQRAVPLGADAVALQSLTTLHTAAALLVAVEVAASGAEDHPIMRLQSASHQGLLAMVVALLSQGVEPAPILPS